MVKYTAHGHFLGESDHGTRRILWALALAQHYQPVAGAHALAFGQDKQRVDFGLQ